MTKYDEILKKAFTTYNDYDRYITAKCPDEYVKKSLNQQYGADAISNRKTFSDIVISGSCTYSACYPYKVIYSGPCTIVFFQNGTKEIVRMCPDEKCDDREKAVMYAILKHAIGKKFIKKIFNSAKDYRDEESN